MRSKQFLKKHWGNLLLLAFIILLIVPQTGMPIKVFFNKLLAFSPSEISSDKQQQLEDYHWPMETLQGEKSNLSVSEGKVVLVNIWATWCAPCVAEMPSLQNLYNAYGDKVDFYFLSAESPQKLNRFMERKGYDLPIYQYKYKGPDVLGASSIPTTFILSKKGKIVVKKTGPADWDSENVMELLDQLLAD